ncbi:EboA domain-containing protein [Tuwongella immobilis]|uniref:Uncharacterized protein n=1 Tax=Tuwongella immobilis TaxID=692036 RepID=A0A6C2YKW9_9BACT|nr:EboA domain-containing protein [Tuwongella immobilis]VIP02076.1 Uncharacterized protein OS=Nostoc punctiforme (strain ATCC 29133 / PCC 73102) GN=Npun_F5232 PE=4 SV=1 [Tuwongella immobilis]VTS00315.1 Uncharacterized protein OS=Nostoc punctiforme (strain ATCC 29133 / PCC 73102) GN=Npun_F5232 PE=4 SV=1 [Tuwongella immobilis]
MAESTIAVRCAELLGDWLQPVIPSTARSWLADRLRQISEGDQSALFLGFGMVPRKTGKADLRLSAAQLAAAQEARPGWNPATWSIDQAARTLLLLAYPADAVDEYTDTLDKLFAAGEVGELVALYQALPLLPFPDAHVWRTRECIRTNMKSVFCAVAHRNPYPAEHLDEASWNQLILKCLFVGAALDPVVGLDSRVNPRLMTMLVDYAHERWAAKRQVSPELWRPVGPVADARALADLEKVYTEGTPPERQAAALALSVCPLPSAETILNRNPLLATQARCRQLTWSQIAADSASG